MDYLWIYVGIFIILAIRGIAKTVSKQIEAEKGNAPKPTLEDIFQREFEQEMQRYSAEQQPKTPKKRKAQPSPQPQTTQTSMRTILPKVHKNTKIEEEEQSEPLFSTTDDIRRGIIAAEIFNRKY